MVNVSKKLIIHSFMLMVIGVLLNRGIAELSSVFGLPLYLDSIGSMIVATLGGSFPGMLVGFVSNMIGGIKNTSSFYYGTINVLIAWIAGHFAERGYFDKYTKVLRLLGLYILLSIVCSLLTYILFDFSVGDNVAAPAVTYLHEKGLSVLSAQILGDFAVEIPDKLISLTITFIIYKLIPEDIKTWLGRPIGKDIKKHLNKEEQEIRSSLRTQLAIGLFIAGLAIVLVAFFVSYKSYMETRVEGFATGTYDIHELRIETLLYSGKMLSAVLGLLLCIVSFTMVLTDSVLVKPLHRMAREMRKFAYDSDSGRDKSVEKIESLDIHTGNEIEELYMAISKTVKDIDDYIDTTERQAETISDLHVNIITTLADIVESRDETTGFHVKRTADYTGILARELKRMGKHTELLTDEYINTLTIAAPLHDIGKIKIPDAILNKPGRLTDEEFEVIKTHTTLGRNMLVDASVTMGTTEYLQMAQDIAHYHHEWWDGSSRGYPAGLKGEDIPLSARIMAVADVLDALLSNRPYKEGYSIEKSYQIMKEESGTHFDPDIIEALVNVRDEIEKTRDMYDKMLTE